MPPEVRSVLEQCRETLRLLEGPAALDGLAADLVEHVLQLLEGQRLTAPFLKRSLETLAEVPQLASIIGAMHRFAGEQTRALGHREFTASETLPLVTSVHSDSQLR